MSTSEAGVAGPGTVGGTPARKPRRISFLLILGLVAVLAALGVRWSPWVEEYQLKRASLPALQNWAASDPRNPRVQFYLGTASYNQGMLPEALQAFQRAATLDPKSARGQLGLSLVQRSLGRTQEAADSARQATRLEPKSVDAQFTLAYVTYDLSRTSARLEFEKASKLAPKRADIWHWLGQCSVDLNDPSTALAPLQKAVSLEPNNPVYRRDLGEVLLTLSRFDEAQEHLELAASRAPEDPEALYLLGRWQATVASKDEELSRAADLMHHSIERMRAQERPDKINIAAVQYEMAEVLRQMKRHKEARRILTDARKLDPANLQVMHRLALTMRDLGETGESRKLLAEYTHRSTLRDSLNNMIQRVKQDGKNAPLRLRLARLFAATGDPARAINQYDVCLWLDPKQTAAKQERAALVKKAEAEAKSQATSAPRPAQGAIPAP